MIRKIPSPSYVTLNKARKTFDLQLFESRYLYFIGVTLVIWQLVNKGFWSNLFFDNHYPYGALLYLDILYSISHARRWGTLSSDVIYLGFLEFVWKKTSRVALKCRYDLKFLISRGLINWLPCEMFNYWSEKSCQNLLTKYVVSIYSTYI